MSLTQLKSILKEDTLPGLVLVYGEETYLVDQAAALIRDSVVPMDARDFNLTQFEGRDFRPHEVIEAAQTMSVFAPRKLVHIKNLHEAKTEQLDGLLEYLDNPTPETTLLLTAQKIDSRRKFFQKVRKSGLNLEFKTLYDNQLPPHVREMGRQKGITFTSDALKLFCKRVGTNLAEVHGELDKLISYIGERDLVDEADVVAIVSDTRVESIFGLMDAIGRAQRDVALRLLSRLIDEGQAPLMILSMIVRHFRQMWKLRALQQQGVPQKEMPRLVGASPYFLAGLLDQSSRYRDVDYQQAFEYFLATDLAIKSSGGEPQAHLEKLVFDLTQLSGKEKGAA